MGSAYIRHQSTETLAYPCCIVRAFWPSRGEAAACPLRNGRATPFRSYRDGSRICGTLLRMNALSGTYYFKCTLLDPRKSSSKKGDARTSNVFSFVGRF